MIARTLAISTLGIRLSQIMAIMMDIFSDFLLIFDQIQINAREKINVRKVSLIWSIDSREWVSVVEKPLGHAILYS